MSSGRFIVADFADGIQVIPKMWLQNEKLCKYPLHYKTDKRIRKAIEKEEIPCIDWPSCNINRIFGEYSSIQKADEKAQLATYTSDMDTEKESKYNRKHRARIVLSSSESEEQGTSITLPVAPRPPAKRQRLCNEDENILYCKKKFNGFHDTDSLCSHSPLQDENQYIPAYTTEENNDNLLNRNISKRDITERLHRTQANHQTENDINQSNDQFSHPVYVDHLKRLTREIATIKYDMRQILTLLDILVKKSNEKTGTRETFSFEAAENLFPLQTVPQLTELETILKDRNSRLNAEIRAYIKSIGGTNVDDAVKRILYKTFSNKLAEKYNWEGRRGKEPLCNLEIIKVIFRSILDNIADSDQNKIQRRMMEWFLHSKARNENEKKRNNNVLHPV